MEELKPFEELLQPDVRSACRRYTLEVLHDLARQYELSPAAPESVRHQFEVARHAYVYAALYTPLCAAAELYAILAVEHALRIRYQATDKSKEYKSEPGLKQLLKIAISEEWVRDEGFDIEHRRVVVTPTGVQYEPVPPEERKRNTDIVLDVLPDIRNEIAHGQSSMALEQVSVHLQRAAEIINQLFPPSTQT